MMRDPLSSAHAKCVSTFQEREEVPVMAIVGGFDIHRRQVTFDYLCDMRPLAMSESVKEVSVLMT